MAQITYIGPNLGVYQSLNGYSKADLGNILKNIKFDLTVRLKLMIF